MPDSNAQVMPPLGRIGGTGTRTMMGRLARRAKWRKRFSRWKTMLVLLLAGSFMVISIGIFHPRSHEYAFQWIDGSKYGITEGTDSQVVQPVAVERMYYLGCFLSMTMRKQEAMDCWDETHRWLRGAKRMPYFYNSGKSKREVKKYLRQHRMHPEGIRWVGYSLYQMGNYLRLKRKHQFSQEIFHEYLALVDKHDEGEDPDMTRRSQLAILKYRGGY